VDPNAKPWSGLITPSDDGSGNTVYSLYFKNKFPNIPDLIEHYQANSIPYGKGEVKLTVGV
jgi:hypothetical protein